MQIRLADYVARFLTSHGVTDSFSVTGGGAMHLNDALGHEEGLHTTYCHHEQACAIAAEAYARLNNRIASVCVTTGPGGTNAITGVLGGYLDSIPMFILSGQVRYDTTARYQERFTEGYPLRAVGDQEYDILKSVRGLTKYAVMIEDPLTIRYHLEKAWYLALHGRPGPVWIDIPVNFQGTVIETDGLKGFSPEEEERPQDMPEPLPLETVRTVLSKIRAAKRPVFYAGNGIRLSGGYDCFREAVDLLGIPVCTYWDAVDLIETEHPLYTGRGGNMGDRAGNFAVQNADLVLAVGNRLPIRVVGYSFDTWARAAEVIMVDTDPAELRKKTIHVEMPIHADAKDFLKILLEILKEGAGNSFSPELASWQAQCLKWKLDYPVVLPRHYAESDGFANAYAAFDLISRSLPEGTVTVTANGTCCVAGHQSWFIKKGSRFFNNNAVASMGYGLPASVGACLAAGKAPVVCLEGDGSLMMNLQELQTVVTNGLPVKMFLINNSGYHSIRQTQTNLFGHHTKVGIGPESGDLSFPDFRKVFEAFGWPYEAVHSNEELPEAVKRVLEAPGFAVLEIFVSTTQFFEPKSSTKRLPDGTLLSPPLEDLAPFLPREEFERNMYIPPLS